VRVSRQAHYRAPTGHHSKNDVTGRRSHSHAPQAAKPRGERLITREHQADSAIVPTGGHSSPYTAVTCTNAAELELAVGRWQPLLAAGFNLLCHDCVALVGARVGEPVYVSAHHDATARRGSSHARFSPAWPGLVVPAVLGGVRGLSPVCALAGAEAALTVRVRRCGSRLMTSCLLPRAPLAVTL